MNTTKFEVNTLKLQCISSPESKNLSSRTSIAEIYANYHFVRPCFDKRRKMQVLIRSFLLYSTWSVDIPGQGLGAHDLDISALPSQEESLSWVVLTLKQ